MSTKQQPEDPATGFPPFPEEMVGRELPSRPLAHSGASSSLPEGLLRTLATIDAPVPFVLIIRHAERLPIPSNDPYADVNLTERGQLDASSLASALPSRPHWAAVSPFLRCTRTAELLGVTQHEVDQRLGNPGPWVIDGEEGARLFSRQGTEGVVRAQIAGERWDFIREAQAGMRLLLSAALERLDAGRGHGVCVSHDSVLMPALAVLAGERFEGTWLAPLEGFAVRRTRRGLLCTWRGKHHEVEPW